MTRRESILAEIARRKSVERSPQPPEFEGISTEELEASLK